MPEQKTIEERAEELLLAVEGVYGDAGHTTRDEASKVLLAALQSVAREAREAEREACAKVAEELWVSEPTDYPQQIAQAIREREGNGSEGKHE